jgi:hypothetical protein
MDLPLPKKSELMKGMSSPSWCSVGDKSSQTKDVALALELNRNFTEKQK